MGWQGYIPKDVWDKFKEDDPIIAEELECYGMVRKHGGATANHELVSLFETIKGLKVQLGRMNIEMKEREEYTTSLEEKVFKLRDALDKVAYGIGYDAKDELDKKIFIAKQALGRREGSAT